MASSNMSISFDSQHTQRPTIGYFVTEIERDWALWPWLGISDAAARHDINLFTCTGRALRWTQNFEDQANIVYALANRRRLDGLIIWKAGMGMGVTESEFGEFCRRYRLPVITLEGAVQGFPCVTYGNYQGMRMAVEHLIEEHGYRRIGFVGMLQHHSGFQERYRAYTDTLAAYHLPVEPILAKPWFPDEALLPADSHVAEHVLSRWLDEALSAGVEAIVGVCDTVTIQVMKLLQLRGIGVPGDIALISFDDFIESQALTPPLTTVMPSWYELGQRAVNTIIDMLAGRPTPDRVIVQPRLMVRQSCGCADPSVARAAVHSEEPLSVEQNTDSNAIPAEMTTLLAPVVSSDIAERLPQMLSRLIDAFNDDLHRNPPGRFLGELEHIIRQNLSVGIEAAHWQNALSVLRRQLACSPEYEEWTTRAEDLCQQARVLIGALIERHQVSQRLQVEQQADRLREVSQTLITTFDVANLIAVLAEGLPDLGIPECYLVLYESPQPYSYPDPAPEWSRLMLAYAEGRYLSIEAEGRRFPSWQLVPPDVLSPEKRVNLLVKPLYFRETQIGIAFFAPGPREGKIYEALRSQISNALQGALLVQHVQEHSAELARKQYILDTFMANVPDSIYFKDEQGRIIQANQALLDRFGLHEPNDIIGKTDFDLFPEAQARSKYDQEQAVIRSGQPISAVEEPDAGGRWALTTKMPLRDEHGRIIGTFGISRDITELKHTEHELLRHRRHLEELVAERTIELTQTNTQLQAEIAERSRAEHALRISEQQYRLLAENVIDGVIMVQDGHMMFTNTVFAAMLGYAPEQLMGTPLLSVFHERAKESAHACLTGSENTFPRSRRQAELLTRDGRVIWTEIDQTRIQWDNTPAMLLTIRDITDRKLREERLEKERTRLQQENLTLKSTIAERYRFGAIVGKSSAMQRIYELILSAATSEVNTLLSGESGTGKELMARTIHDLSTRKQHAFVAVNCASIPETLFEREFFGHRRGAFTGADRDRPGLFDRAHKGTLFLDEVTELSPGAQARLLRVLQDGSYTPLGGATSKKADVLVVAATNKDCNTLIAQGLLREDFFYRIGVIEIQIPALRERKEDLPLLIDHLLEEYRRKQEQLHGGMPPDFPTDQAALPAEFIRAFYTYHWPGNVRELRNILHRYLATRRLDLILPRLGASTGPHSAAQPSTDLNGVPLPDAVKAYEKRIIAEVLAQHHGRTGPASEQLGITQRTLQNKIKNYRLRENT